MSEQARQTPDTDDHPAEAPETRAMPEAAADEAAFRAMGGEADADAATDALADRIAELEAERDELKKRLMYALADAENIRKRAERERRDAEAYGGTRLARDLLSVHDNLRRATETADDALRAGAPAFFEGIDLTQRELLNAFAKHRIETVVPEKGAAFDPNLHQAMFEVPVPGAASGTVVEVMQTGFTIAGRLLRPALVGVAKAADPA
jgi:molecular chaperone GrpE